MVYTGPTAQAADIDGVTRYLSGLKPAIDKENYNSVDRHRRCQSFRNVPQLQTVDPGSSNQRRQRHTQQYQKQPRNPRSKAAEVSEPDAGAIVLETMVQTFRIFWITFVTFMAIRTGLYFIKIATFVATVAFVNVVAGVALLLSNVAFVLALLVAICSRFIFTFPLLSIAFGVAASRNYSRRSRNCRRYREVHYHTVPYRRRYVLLNW